MELPRFDFRYFPLLLVHVPPTVTPEAMPPFYRRWERICEEHGPHAVVIDFRRIDPVFMDFPLRRAATEESLKGRELYAKNLLVEARVVTHPISRAILTTFNWIVAVPWAVSNFASEADAIRWTAEHARRRGLAIDRLPKGFDELEVATGHLGALPAASASEPPDR